MIKLLLCALIIGYLVMTSTSGNNHSDIVGKKKLVEETKQRVAAINIKRQNADEDNKDVVDKEDSIKKEVLTKDIW